MVPKRGNSSVFNNQLFSRAKFRGRPLGVVVERRTPGTKVPGSNLLCVKISNHDSITARNSGKFSSTGDSVDSGSAFLRVEFS